MREIVSKGIMCDRCGEMLVIDGEILEGYAMYEVIDEPEIQHYLCPICNEIWRSYYVMVGWQVKHEILIIEPN